MTVLMFWPFAAGLLVGAIIVAVFDGARFWKQCEWARKANTIIRELNVKIAHLEQEAHPREWVNDDPSSSVRIKEHLYDKYEELYQPGGDVIQIEDQGDIPDLPPSWRDKVGDE